MNIDEFLKTMESMEKNKKDIDAFNRRIEREIIISKLLEEKKINKNENNN